MLIADAVAANNGPALYAGVLAGTASLDPNHGPVLDIFLLAAAEEASAGALLKEQGTLLIFGERAFVVTDIASTVRPGHRLPDTNNLQPS